MLYNKVKIRCKASLKNGCDNMKRNVLFASLFIMVLLFICFLYNRMDSESSYLIDTVDEISYEISEEDYIQAIALAEDVPYESAKVQFDTERASRVDDSQGSYSYIAVETTYSSSDFPGYSATIVGNYEIYSFEDSNEITGSTTYSKGSSPDSKSTWIQTTVSVPTYVSTAVSEDGTLPPSTIAYNSVTGHFQEQGRWKTKVSESISLSQKFDLEAQ